MKTPTRTYLFSLLLASTSAVADTYESRNITPGDLLSGVKRIEVKQTGQTPLIRVISDGKTYSGVQPGQQIVWQASTYGQCRGLRKIREFRWWLNDNSSQSPNSYYAHHQQVASKDWITSKSKSIEYSASGSLAAPVSAKLANAARQACNSYLQAELAKGKDLRQVLEHDRKLPLTEQPLLAGVVYLQCSEDGGGLNTKLGHAWQNVKIETLCEGYAYPPSVTKPQGLDLAAAFVLETPKLKIDPAQYSGSCPVTLPVEGTLKANQGQQPVQYRWAHNGAMGPVYNANLNTSGWRTVSTQLKDIGKPAAPDKQFKQPAQGQNQGGLQFKAHADNVHTGQVELLVLAAGENDWSKAKRASSGYQVTCKTPVQPGLNKLVAPQPGATQADLSYGPNLTIGSTTGQWGTNLKVDASHAARQREDSCELRLVYDVVNPGGASAGAFASRVREGQEWLHSASLPGLAANAQHKVSGLVYLANGTHLLRLAVDDQQQVAESNEGNNQARVTVEVSNCSNARPGMPPARNPALPQ